MLCRPTNSTQGGTEKDWGLKCGDWRPGPGSLGQTNWLTDRMTDIFCRPSRPPNPELGFTTLGQYHDVSTYLRAWYKEQKNDSPTPFWHGRTEGCTGSVRESILSDRSSRSIFGDFLFYHTAFVRESCTVLTTLLSNRCFLANICSMLFSVKVSMMFCLMLSTDAHNQNMSNTATTFKFQF